MNPFLLRIGNKLDSRFIWKRYSKLCIKAGIRSSKLIVSFDCDTPEDAGVVLDVHDKLWAFGVNAAYAVPGELIESQLKIYKQLLHTGAEFLNHGGRNHTFFNQETKRYESNFFYDQQSQADLIEDIEKGHQVLTNLLGIRPVGWRTPHFGTFQGKDQFRFLYNSLSRLKYAYSSSRLPHYAYAKGPVVAETRYGIFEVPVTGGTDYPFSIMDSWAFFASPNRTKSPKNYLEECRKLADIADRLPILINIYADPSHVSQHAEFFEGINCLSRSAKATTFRDLIKEIS